MSPLPVKPEFGPTLPEAAGPLWRRAPRAVRAAVVVVALAVVALLAATALLGGPGASGERRVVVERPVAYNLRHGAALRPTTPHAGESLRLEAHRDGLFLQSFAVSSLELPPYRGTPSGPYAVAAEELKARLARRFFEFELVEEGRARINQVPGYEVVFTARSDEGRRLYGRWVMLVPLTDPPTPQRRGVTLELLGTPAAGIPNAESVGDVGQLKLPMRSFRFGTDAP